MAEEKAVSTGNQAVNAAADAAKQEASAPFFEYADPTGKKETFATRDELTASWRKSKMQEADYTRKTQELAQQRKQHEEALKKFQEDQKAFLENRKRYDTWDEKLKARPDVQQMLMQYLDQPENPNVAYQRAEGLISEKEKALMERIEALEGRFKETDSRREIEEAFAVLKDKYPDADEAAIMERLESISDGSVSKLIDQLYWAGKGQFTPAEVEQKVVANLQKKEAARLNAPAAHTRETPKVYKSMKEAREAAMKAEGIAG